jgi:hypothetical protein
MEQIEEYTNSLSDYQINEIYTFYDSGGYDYLMKYPSTIVPRLDISLRRNTLVEYLAEFLETPDPDVPDSILDGTCSFEMFRCTLQNQCIGEPLMHRLNQGTNKPDLEGSPVLIEMRKERIEGLKECLDKVHGLLKEILEYEDGSYMNKVFERNEVLAREAKDLIEEFL